MLTAAFAGGGQLLRGPANIALPPRLASARHPPAPLTPAPPQQEVANFFVGQARRNRHAPRSQQEEESLLIYNWAPAYTGKVRVHMGVGHGWQDACACVGGWGGLGWAA